MRGVIRARGYAKLNLALAVTGRRPDGYHLLDTVMRTLDLYDEVTVEGTDQPGVLLSSDDPRLPRDGHNSAFRAAGAYIRAAEMPGGVRIDIRKQIPMEAGMGGSSADAAAVLNALQALWKPLPDAELFPLAVSLGADVPFQLRGGLARCRGVGERIDPLPPLSGDVYVILKPAFGIRTPDAFAAFDRLSRPDNPDTERLCAALAAGDLRSAVSGTGNALERAVRRPEIGALREKLDAEGALASAMTGSGSAVFGLFDSPERAGRAAERLRGLFCGGQPVQVLICAGLDHPPHIVG